MHVTEISLTDPLDINSYVSRRITNAGGRVDTKNHAIADSPERDYDGDHDNENDDDRNDDPSRISETTLGQTPDFSKFDNMSSSGDDSLPSTQVLSSTPSATPDAINELPDLPVEVPAPQEAPSPQGVPAPPEIPAPQEAPSPPEVPAPQVHGSHIEIVNFPFEIPDSQADPSEDFSEVDDNPTLRGTNSGGMNNPTK